MRGLTSEVNWIAAQLMQQDGRDKLPQWIGNEQLWYCSRDGSHHKEFLPAVRIQMGIKKTYEPLAPMGKARKFIP